MLSNWTGLTFCRKELNINIIKYFYFTIFLEKIQSTGFSKEVPFSLQLTTLEGFVDSVDQDQTAHSVQSDL